MKEAILVVDDEEHIREMLQEYLTKHGYGVLTAESAQAARNIVTAHPVDLVLLDVNMPGEDGLSLARHFGEHHHFAVIMLTAADTVIDRIIGLEIGADDYITKPFDPRELLARIRSVLRRTRPATTAPTPATDHTHGFTIGDKRLDLEQRRLFRDDGHEVPLTSGEFDLLKLLVEHPNRVLSRDQILDMTQNRDWDPFDRSVDIRITRLRKKIEPEPEKPRFIKTVRGAGYRFVPDGE